VKKGENDIMSFRRGQVEGKCPRCGQILRRKHPIDYAVCDCYKYCPLCDPPYSVLMTSYTPDLNPQTYKIAKDLALKDTVVLPREDDMETIYVCLNHSPPHYSKQKPVEVRLS